MHKHAHYKLVVVVSIPASPFSKNNFVAHFSQTLFGRKQSLVHNYFLYGKESL